MDLNRMAGSPTMRALHQEMTDHHTEGYSFCSRSASNSARRRRPVAIGELPYKRVLYDAHCHNQSNYHVPLPTTATARGVVTAPEGCF